MKDLFDKAEPKKVAEAVSCWMVLKSVINLILGFSAENVVMLAVAIALGYTLITKRSYMNIVTAVLLAVIVLIHLWDNLTNARILYLLEAVIDALSITVLVVPKQVRAYFNNEF